MVQKSDQLRVKCLLTEAITLLCKSGLSYSSQLSVEGLLGITLDHGDIFLVNINETITSDLSAAQQVAANGFSGSKPDVCSVLDVIRDEAEDRSRLSDDIRLDEQTENIATHVELGEETVLQSEVERLEDGLEDDDDDLHEHLGEGTSMDCEFNDDALFGGKSRKLGLMEGELGTAVFNSDDIASLLGKVVPDDDDTVHAKVEHHAASSLAPNAVDRVVDTAEDGILTSWALDDQHDAMPLNLADDMHTELGTNCEQLNPISKPVAGQCVECGKVYRSKQGLKKHKCLSTLVTGRPSETSQPLDLTVVRVSGDAPYSCEVCARSFADYTSCVTHTCTACHVCDLCGARLRSHCGYTKHRLRHAGTYQFHCSMCRKGFFDQTNLRAHMDASHSKVRRHACPSCQKSFFWKHHLKRHVAHCSGAAQAQATEMHHILKSSGDK